MSNIFNRIVLLRFNVSLIFFQLLSLCQLLISAVYHLKNCMLLSHSVPVNIFWMVKSRLQELNGLVYGQQEHFSFLILPRGVKQCEKSCRTAIVVPSLDKRSVLVIVLKGRINMKTATISRFKIYIKYAKWNIYFRCLYCPKNPDYNNNVYFL